MSDQELELKEPKRFQFSPLQIQAVIGINKINETTKKYIELLNKKIIDLSNQAMELRKQASNIDNEIQNLNQEILAAEKQAKIQYDETLKTVVSEFDTPPPPWRASVVVDNGIPVGVDLLRD